METKILNLLKEKNELFLSGEEISHRLKVSRAAVWKHIQHLRQIGYEIIAQPHLGYRLVKIPDLLLPDEIKFDLKTKIMGKEVLAYALTASTNEVAYKLAEQSCREGLLVVSEAQSRGKGRLGREWVSPRSKGIYLSLVLRPDISPVQAGRITLMAAVSITLTLNHYAGVEARIKWPNDIYLDGGKVCGILTEMNAEMDKINFIILGAGINVNADRNDLPEIATSLNIKTRRMFSRVELLKQILLDFEGYYLKMIKGEFNEILTLWRDLSLTLGKRVEVKCQGKIIQGQAMDINEDGALIIRDDFGFSHHILSGDVELLR